MAIWMAITAKQLRAVDDRVEYITITNSTRSDYPGQRNINVRAAIRMAFVLGARFGVAHPTIASDYMKRWLQEYIPDDDVAPLRHQTAMLNCIRPITHYMDDEEEGK